MSLNVAIIQGRLTKDPDLRRTQNGTPVASFTVACDRDYSSGGEKETDFINCVAWRTTAEFCSKYLRKGSMALITGRIQNRQYTDKEGNKRAVTEIVADKVHFGESKRDRDEDDYARSERAGKQDYQPAGKPVSMEVDEYSEGELPF